MSAVRDEFEKLDKKIEELEAREFRVANTGNA